MPPSCSNSNPHQCRLCNKEFKYIAYHLKNKHKVLDLAEYYKKYVLETDKTPLCKKCGQPTALQSVLRGFYKSCHPSCSDSAKPINPKPQELKHPVKRRKRSIVSRRAGRTVPKKRRTGSASTIKMPRRSFFVNGRRRSQVPRVHSTTEFGEFLLRSKIERNFVHSLLKVKQYVIKVEYERTHIRYYSSSQSKYRRYIPDFKIFWINGLVDIVEIKPEKDKIDPIVVDKQKQATKYCNSNGMNYYMLSPKEYQKFIECRIVGIPYKNV